MYMLIEYICNGLHRLMQNIGMHLLNFISMVFSDVDGNIFGKIDTHHWL